VNALADLHGHELVEHPDELERHVLERAHVAEAVDQVGGQRRDAALVERREHVVVPEVDRIHDVLQPEGVRLAPDHLLLADAQRGLTHVPAGAALEIELAPPAPRMRLVEAMRLGLAFGLVDARRELLLDRAPVADHVSQIVGHRRPAERVQRQEFAARRDAVRVGRLEVRVAAGGVE